MHPMTSSQSQSCRDVESVAAALRGKSLACPYPFPRVKSRIDTISLKFTKSHFFFDVHGLWKGFLNASSASQAFRKVASFCQLLHIEAHLLEAKTDANFVPSKLHALQTTDDAKEQHPSPAIAKPPSLI
eukprot:2427499-Amphidinium_carterae.1